MSCRFVCQYYMIHPFRKTTYQTILEFGGAFTDSASYVFSKLNSSLQTQLLDMYFSEDGQHYNMARYPIGSCDFSLEHYTYDDVDGDTSLDHFSIDHDTKLRIPFLQRALKTRSNWTKEDLYIVASLTMECSSLDEEQ